MTTTTYTSTAATTAKPLRPPAFTRTRRALIRLQAAHTTRQIIRELIAQPEPRHGRRPTSARFQELTDRYAALGGEPSDLLGKRPPFSGGGAIRALRSSLRARHDEWLRRELDAGQTARAHHREVGGDFHVLP